MHDHRYELDSGIAEMFTMEKELPKAETRQPTGYLQYLHLKPRRSIRTFILIHTPFLIVEI